MRIFISGVAGFLGSHLADRFIEQGHEVVGCDNLLGGDMDNINPRVEFYSYDCKHRNSMLKITKDCDVIYHCAATAYEGLSVFSPHFITENIFQITMSLLSAAISNKVKRFVLCSSMARYGTQDEVPFRETMIPKPQDPYGIAKYAAELELINLCETHGIEWVIAVPHNIIGPRQRYYDPYRNVASIMINRLLQEKPPIIYGDGTQKRCFSFIQDDIDILEKFATDPRAKNEIFNIGPDDEFITINELADMLMDLLGIKKDVIYYPDRPQEVKLANCSCDKVRRVFGYEPKYKLREGLKDMIYAIQKKGTRPFQYHIDLEIDNELTPITWKEQVF